jgi:hypothetical protein
MWLCSQNNISNSHKRLFVPDYNFYRIDSFRGRKAATAVAVRKGIPHSSSSSSIYYTFQHIHTRPKPLDTELVTPQAC